MCATIHFDFEDDYRTVETSVTVNNSPTQDYIHPADHSQPIFEMTTGFKPSNLSQWNYQWTKQKWVVCGLGAVLLFSRSGFKMFLRAWKVFGTFEKRAPSQSQGWVEWLLHDMGYQSMSGTLFKYSTDNRSMWAFCYGFVNKLSISLEGLLNADMKSWLVSCSWWALMESIPARFLSLCTPWYDMHWFLCKQAISSVCNRVTKWMFLCLVLNWSRVSENLQWHRPIVNLLECPPHPSHLAC